VRVVRAPAFLPGQFNMVYLHGVGEVPLSIASGPGRSGVLRHTIRAVGPVTRGVQTLGRGGVLGIRGPFGVGWPLDRTAGRDVVVIAGGVAMAALHTAVAMLVAGPKRSGRLAVLYGAETPADLLFRRDLERWGTTPGVDLQVSVERPDDGWDGSVGVVTDLVSRVRFDVDRVVALIAGPEAMMRRGALDLEERGVAPDRIYLSLERNMKCGVGHCGHCQVGPVMVCREGPVVRYDTVRELLAHCEV
jgi:NAD(P)H-flavin reductase